MRPSDERYRDALRLMPDGLYPRALSPIRRNDACRISEGGWYVWRVWSPHGHRPIRIDGYAAEDCRPGQFVRLVAVPSEGDG